MKLNRLAASICCLAGLISLLMLSCVRLPTEAPSLPPAQIPAPAAGARPVKFDLVSMTVIPQEVEAGSLAQAVVSIKNTGTARNAYVGTLYVDGQEYGRQDVTLDPGQYGTLVFPVSDHGPGTHKLTMAGLEGSLRVYTVEKYTLANNTVFLPHYTNLEATSVPSVPHMSGDSFAPPVTPFYITRINFRYPYPQSFKILDENKRQIYSSGLTNMDSASVPNIQVNGEFTIEMQTNQLFADVRLQSFGYYTYTYTYVISYFWPEVSTLEGFQKRFAP